MKQNKHHLFMTRQGCTLQNITGSPKVANHEIWGTQHLNFMKKSRFSQSPKNKHQSPVAPGRCWGTALPGFSMIGNCMKTNSLGLCEGMGSNVNNSYYLFDSPLIFFLQPKKIRYMLGGKMVFVFLCYNADISIFLRSIYNKQCILYFS